MAALLSISQPPEFNPNSVSRTKEWKKWKRDFLFYFRASGAENTLLTEDAKIALLLHVIGDEGRDAYEGFTWPLIQLKTLETVLDKFDEHYTPLIHENIESHVFQSRDQKPEETFDQFLGDIKRISLSCNFGDQRDKMLVDRIIKGVYSDDLREKLLNSIDNETPLTLGKVIGMCQRYEVTKQHVKELNKHSDINVVQQGKHNVAIQRSTCMKCEKYHPFGECPAYGHKCRVCNRKNHYEECCSELREKFKNGSERVVNKSCSCRDKCCEDNLRASNNNNRSRSTKKDYDSNSENDDMSPVEDRNRSGIRILNRELDAEEFFMG